MDRYILGSGTECVKLEGKLKQNNLYSESLILWTYPRYRLQQVYPHNRDVRPKTYLMHQVCLLQTEHTQHSPPRT